MSIAGITRTLGKARGLGRISDGAGRFGILAIDQRRQLLDLVADATGRPASEVGEEVGTLKALLAQALAADVTGVLVDPTFGYRPVLAHVPRATGLLLALEDGRWHTDPAGYRTTTLEPAWGVEEAVRAGGEALKLLVWFRPDAPEAVRRHQQRLVREVGEGCRRWERPFVLEILPYQLPGEVSDEYQRRLPELNRASAVLWADPEYGVDLYKLPFPGAAEGVREWGGRLYALADLRDLMREITGSLPAPWVVLSGGMSEEHFIQAHVAALDAGARGYLAGRAIWGQAVAHYPDRGAVEAALRAGGRATLRRLNEALAALPPKGSPP